MPTGNPAPDNTHLGVDSIESDNLARVLQPRVNTFLKANASNGDGALRNLDPFPQPFILNSSKARTVHRESIAVACRAEISSSPIRQQAKQIGTR